MSVETRPVTPPSACLWLALALAAAPPLAAAEEAKEVSYPRFSGEVVFELQNDDVYQSPDPEAEESSLGLVIEPDLFLHLSERFYVNAGLTLEDVEAVGEEGEPGYKGESFGAAVGTFTLNYEREELSLYGGKFGPNFSLAYDAAAGLYGADRSGDEIELADFLGAGGSVRLTEGHSLSGSVFRADRSTLSKPLFPDRDRLTLADGGPGNTEGFESFAFALDGEEFPRAPGLRYHLGWARLGVEEGDSENRLAAAAEYAVEMENETTVTTLGELVRVMNADGDPEVDRNYMTASVLGEYKGWNAAFALTTRNTSGGEEDGSVTDYQISGGYAFEQGISLDVGWKRTREDAGNESTLGALISWGLEF